MGKQAKLKTECVVCGQVTANESFVAIDRLYGIKGEYTYARCPKCKLIFNTAHFTPEDISRFYPSNYDAHHITEETEITDSAKKESGYHHWRRFIIRWIRNHLVNRLKGIRIKRFIYKKLNSSSKVLDVGCGVGQFLYHLKSEKGAQVFGIEISENAYKIGRDIYKLDIFHGELADAPFKSKAFDLITAWWSLEHMLNPENNIKKMRDMLKDEGHLIIGVPNSKSINAFVFKDRWYHLDCPRHLHLWNISAMNELLRRCGLNIQKIIFDKTPWGFLGSLQYVFFQNNYVPKHKDKILRNRVLYLLALPWTLLVGLIKLSDIMVIYCIKEEKR